MAKQRNFTPEFKVEVVIEALSGQSSQAELCRKHKLKNEELLKLYKLITRYDRFAIQSVSITSGITGKRSRDPS